MSKDKERQLIHHQSHQYIESPYLPSIEAGQYEALRAGFIDHLMENVTKEREHRHSLEKEANSAGIKIGYIEAFRRVLNPIIALLTIVPLLGIIYYGFSSGHPTEAVALAGVTGGIITAFKWLDNSTKK